MISWCKKSIKWKYVWLCQLTPIENIDAFKCYKDDGGGSGGVDDVDDDGSELWVEGLLRYIKCRDPYVIFEFTCIYYCC